MARDPGVFGSGHPQFALASPAALQAAATPLTTAEVAAFLQRLPDLDAAVPDAERIDQIALLEAVKNAAAGAQAAVAVAFAASQREIQAAAGVPARRRGVGVAAQVALARRESPHTGSRHLGLAQALHSELPRTRAHLAAGRVGEWTATLVARETAHLDPEQRRAVDAAIAADLPAWSPPRAQRQVRALAQRLDPAAAVARNARAERERRVTLRPAPDTMALLTAMLPVAQGVAAYAALTRAAAQAVGTGAAGTRSRAQVMADTLVERLTGQSDASTVPVEVQLVMTDTTLLVGGDEPAHLPGHGPIPAALARRLLRADPGDSTPADPCDCTPVDPGDSTLSDLATGCNHDQGGTTCSGSGPGNGTLADEAAVWVRRLYTSPDRGALVALDSHRRVFAGGLRRFLIARDQTCRTPWCDAPIREADHAHPDRAGGPTTAANGQGLCQACNHAKEALGWRHQVTDPGPLPQTGPPADHPPDGHIGRRHTVQTTTPTGHRYDSAAPRPPGWDPWPPPESALERHVEQLVAA